MYENVGSLGERETLPIPAASVGVVSGTAVSAKEDKRGMYENVSLKARLSPDLSPPAPAYSQVRQTEVKRSTQQRQDVFETIQLKSPKVKGGDDSGNRHSNCQSPDSGEK
jgi:hypothetical protein